MLEAGHEAPDFTLPDDTGQSLRLSALKGKLAVVVYFYPKDDTPGCTAEAKAFSDLASEFEAEGAIIAGLSPDSVESHVKFRKKHSLKVMLAADASHATAEAYGVWVEKSMYGKTYMGVERATFLVVKDGTIAKVWRKVKVPGHAAEVLAAVRARGKE